MTFELPKIFGSKRALRRPLAARHVTVPFSASDGEKVAEGRMRWAKDCPAPKGEVMSQFGNGKVDFKAVFAKLKSFDFNGPIMVEGVNVGATAEDLRSLGSDERNSPEAKVRGGPSERARASQTTANARPNREFLEKALAAN